MTRSRRSRPVRARPPARTDGLITRTMHDAAPRDPGARRHVMQAMEGVGGTGNRSNGAPRTEDSGPGPPLHSHPGSGRIRTESAVSRWSPTHHPRPRPFLHRHGSLLLRDDERGQLRVLRPVVGPQVLEGLQLPLPLVLDRRELLVRIDVEHFARDVVNCALGCVTVIGRPTPDGDRNARPGPASGAPCRASAPATRCTTTRSTTGSAITWWIS